MKIIKDALRDFDIRHSISIFDIYFLPHKKVKPCALQYKYSSQDNKLIVSLLDIVTTAILYTYILNTIE